MYFGIVALRVTAILCFAASNSVAINVTTARIGKYPQKVHAFFEERYGAKKTSMPSGIWSAWSSWSQCSRSCGGGIMIQTRYCVNRPTDKRFIRKPRKRHQHTNPDRCIGLYKRIHLCNPQECPFGARDFRMEQCSMYNRRKFKGKLFVWEPFLRAVDECSLNCRPVGSNFYATLNETVIDGTSCFRPTAIGGAPTPRGTKGVCVSGKCMSVNSKGVVGGLDEKLTSPSGGCPACAKGFCRSVNGIYTRSNLPSGYSLIAQIPKGACGIVVRQMNRSRNFIAFKKTNGSFVFNGDWNFATIGRSSYEAAGTKFIYVKQDDLSPEIITSQGPLETPIEIYLVTYEPNVGIKYGYFVPDDIERQIAPPSIRISNNVYRSKNSNEIQITKSLSNNQQRDDPKTSNRIHHHRQRKVKRRYSWKISGISACSRSCGGGIQTTVASCVREITLTPVPDKRCAHMEKPRTTPIRCNVQDCPPKWDGYWSSCSTTCDAGLRTYIIHCKQELNTGREVIVDDNRCATQPKPISKSQPCENQPPCAGSEGKWSTGEWTACSVSCGTGHRTRAVSCPSGTCNHETRPSHAEYCALPSCPRSDSSNIWLLTEWTDCSEGCGTGRQTRYAVCGKSTCDISSKPDLTRDCSSEKHCGGEWFAGPWGSCSDSCSGGAQQRRDVICVSRFRGQSKIADQSICGNKPKPEDARPCSGVCRPFWFVGDWETNCENCPQGGTQRREVKCMDANGVPSKDCAANEKPYSKRSCDCRKKEDKPAQDEPPSSADHNCVDKIGNCYLAVQARLCQYPYYKSQCCVACRKAQQDTLH